MKRLRATTLLGFACGLIALILACETQTSDDNTLRVEPQAIGIRENEAIDFTASGGFSYTWTLSDTSMGLLTTKTGPNTRYVSRFTPSADSAKRVQTLTVTSKVGADPSTSSSTNGVESTTGFTDTAEAVIEHLGAPSTDQETTTTLANEAPASTTTSTTTTTTTTTAISDPVSTTSAPFFPPIP